VGSSDVPVFTDDKTTNYRRDHRYSQSSGSAGPDVIDVSSPSIQSQTLSGRRTSIAPTTAYGSVPNQPQQSGSYGQQINQPHSPEPVRDNRQRAGSRTQEYNTAGNPATNALYAPLQTGGVSTSGNQYQSQPQNTAYTQQGQYSTTIPPTSQYDSQQQYNPSIPQQHVMPGGFYPPGQGQGQIPQPYAQSTSPYPPSSAGYDTPHSHSQAPQSPTYNMGSIPLERRRYSTDDYGTCEYKYLVFPL